MASAVSGNDMTPLKTARFWLDNNFILSTFTKKMQQ